MRYVNKNGVENMAPKIVRPDDPFAEFELVDSVAGETRKSGKPKDPIHQRRQKFLDGLDLQRAILNNPNHTVKRRVYKDGSDGKRWPVLVDSTPRSWQEEFGDLVEVTPRYGNRPVEIAEGKVTARMAKDKIASFYDRLEQMVREGHYDDQFERLTRRRRDGG